MITCTAFRADDVPMPDAEQRAALGNAFTLRRDGKVLACAGIVDTHLGPLLWSWIDPAAPMLVVHRAARRMLEVFHVELSATTAVCFGAGCRWLEMLGFRRSRLLPGWDDGADHYLYVRAP